ncbi:hypothetical protein [Burkholderia stagnalis]|uniref:hypothetical protein n=1 Tax=Burkholderia stagnalis TaxID=1503054 RepID=UPI000F5C0391|nr:hypothetical protein [Burkholderia stagnalis]
MSLDALDFERGIETYWSEIASRSYEIQARERVFPELAEKYSARQPPHFTRSDLELIFRWKYTDARWCNRALDGLSTVSDDSLRFVTGTISQTVSARDAARSLRHAIRGVGIAGISAILAAARPDRFPVIDVFALTAIRRYYDLEWVKNVPHDKDGKLQADEPSYAPYAAFCCDRATELSHSTGHDWTPRRVDMALWGIGKDLFKAAQCDPEYREAIRFV